MTIQELANEYGSLELLTAYIIRTAGVSEERAEEVVVDVDSGLERLLEERFESGRRYICKFCGEEFWFDEDDFCGDGSFHPDGEEALWGHIQIDHPDVFDDVCDFDTPYMIEECYEEDC